MVRNRRNKVATIVVYQLCLNFIFMFLHLVAVNFLFKFKQLLKCSWFSQVSFIPRERKLFTTKIALFLTVFLSYSFSSSNNSAFTQQFPTAIKIYFFVTNLVLSSKILIIQVILRNHPKQYKKQSLRWFDSRAATFLFRGMVVNSKTYQHRNG